jgi:hypothetical protein
MSLNAVCGRGLLRTFCIIWQCTSLCLRRPIHVRWCFLFSFALIAGVLRVKRSLATELSCDCAAPSPLQQQALLSLSP